MSDESEAFFHALSFGRIIFCINNATEGQPLSVCGRGRGRGTRQRTAGRRLCTGWGRISRWQMGSATGACQFGHGVGGFTTNFIHSDGQCEINHPGKRSRHAAPRAAAPLSRAAELSSRAAEATTKSRAQTNPWHTSCVERCKQMVAVRSR